MSGDRCPTPRCWEHSLPRPAKSSSIRSLLPFGKDSPGRSPKRMSPPPPKPTPLQGRRPRGRQLISAPRPASRSVGADRRCGGGTAYAQDHALAPEQEDLLAFVKSQMYEPTYREYLWE